MQGPRRSVARREARFLGPTPRGALSLLDGEALELDRQEVPVELPVLHTGHAADQRVGGDRAEGAAGGGDDAVDPWPAGVGVAEEVEAVTGRVGGLDAARREVL